MSYSTADLRAAAAAGIIAPRDLDNLLAYLATLRRDTSSTPQASRAASILWYAGALIVIGAMGMFSTLAFSQMGGTALTITAVVYAALFMAAGHYLWSVKNLRTPGGLLIAIAVSMTPLAVYGIQDSYDLWSKFGKPGTVRDFYVWIKGSWIFMEVAAIAAATLALRFYRFPFIVVIVAFALWFMSMDIVPWITDSLSKDFETQRQVSIWFGPGMIMSAVVVNARQRTGDFAFWLYLFGVMTFWGAITASSSTPVLAKVLYCAMNVGFLGLAIILGRRVFAVFGTMGLALSLVNFSQTVFGDSLLFPFALSLIGVGIIALGLYYYRHQDAVARWIDERLPAPLKRLRPMDLQMYGA